MHFCDQCNNMYYLKIQNIDQQEQLIYFCRNCGNEKTNLDIQDLQIYHSSNEIDFDGSHLVNEYTKYDKTLPRTKLVTCPNAGCKKDGEILLLRYELQNLKFLFICTSCNHTWKLKS